MIKSYFKKVMALGITTISVFAFNQVGASAEWKKDSNGWWYAQGKSYAKSWLQLGTRWYYFGQDGYMKTGWIQYHGQWYYFYPSGEQAFNTVINGYELDTNGAWIKPSQEAEEARNLILKEDSNFISQCAKNGLKLDRSYREGVPTDFVSKNWNLPNEEVYEFTLSPEGGCYLVGKKSGNIYCVPHEGVYPIYQIKDNKIIKTYYYAGGGIPQEWRFNDSNLSTNNNQMENLDLQIKKADAIRILMNAKKYLDKPSDADISLVSINNKEYYCILTHFTYPLSGVDGTVKYRTTSDETCYIDVKTGGLYTYAQNGQELVKYNR
jgi:hypothetical protein